MAVATDTGLKGTRSQAKWVRVSARKARLVLDGIRGRSVPEARTVLAFSERAVARDIERVLRSAVANVESANEARISGDDLVVQLAYADEGPTLKRWKPRARGRVNRINKRTCHITIELAPSKTAIVAAPSAPRRESKPKVTETAETAAPAAEAKPKRAPRAKKPTEDKPKPTTRKKKEADQ
jgi:large subunit ribosomal protein L22